MNPKITIEDTFSPALMEAFASSRRNFDLAKATNTVMRSWTSYAMAKVPQASRAAIRSRMMAKARAAKFRVHHVKTTKTGKESRSKRYQELKDTAGSYLMWATNWKPRGRSVRKMGSAEYFGALGRFIAARQYSAGYLKSSLTPALNVFRSKLGQAGRLPKYRHAPGRAVLAKPGPVSEARAEILAESILEVAPRAFVDSLPELEATVWTWVQENLIEEPARRAGFTVRRG